MLKEVCRPFSNVEVDVLTGLLVDYCRSKGAQVIVRGLRAISDFEFELQQALMNSRMAPDIETVFLMTRPEHSFLSSSLIKEIASLGGRVSGLVPPPVEAKLRERFPGYPKEEEG